MVKKIKECVDAKKQNNFKFIARSDAKSVELIDKMIVQVSTKNVVVYFSIYIKGNLHTFERCEKLKLNLFQTFKINSL